MIDIKTEEFESMIGAGIDTIPEKYYKNLQNVVFVAADEPTPEQRKSLKLHCNQTLFGLYEGIPLTKRNSNYNLVLPDKITIFRLPIAHISSNTAEALQHVKKTVWHEVAHFFGLDHDRIHDLESK
ncbi:MAG: metallopeptidase family protein [Candidatus Saccharibacteria bacterium]